MINLPDDKDNMDDKQFYDVRDRIQKFLRETRQECVSASKCGRDKEYPGVFLKEKCMEGYEPYQAKDQARRA